MLLIHAPLTKPCEPPAALGYLAASLQQAGINVKVQDFNIEGIHYLLHRPLSCNDTWTTRAVKNVDRNYRALQDPLTYQNRDRYHRAVSDINRIIERHGREKNLQLSLSNYADDRLTPLRSRDLISAAERYSDNIFFPHFKDRLDDLITRCKPRYIGFSVSFLSQALTTFAMIGFLRAHFPKTGIILGGGLISTWFGHSQLDANGVVVDHPFAELVDFVISGPGESAIRSIYKTQTSASPVSPDYSQLRTSPYLAPGFILPYATSIGCYWRKCSFCPETSEKSCYSQLPPARVTQDLQKLMVEFQPSLIHLLDNGIPPATLRAIAGSPPGVPWYGFVRFEPQLTDPDFCKELKQSGCSMLKLGLESGDQQILDTMNKGIDLKRVQSILNNLQAVGISTYVYLLFGTPAETIESAEKTLNFVKANHTSITFLNIAIFNMPVASDEAATLETSSFFEADLAIYRDFVHPRGWSRAKIRRFLDSTFRKAPEINTIIRRDPPFFTSNHASFLAGN